MRKNKEDPGLQEHVVDSSALVQAINLKKYYPVYSGVFRRIKGYVRAVDGVSLSIRQGESLVLVGESGSGKTTLGMLLSKLTQPTSGKIIFKGLDITDKIPKKLRRKIRVVFQDPYASLNPRIKILGQVIEPLIAEGIEKKEAEEKGYKVLEAVGLGTELASKYPHELSGGQRQRAVIARALVTDPEFLVLDEPTSMLDVSIQAQILNLLKRLKQEYSLTYLFITHNLAVARYIGDRIAVMYLGRIVETAPKRTLFSNPLHPYTKALLSAYPAPDPEKPWNPEIPVDIAINPVKLPGGCRFHPRCPLAMEKCKSGTPELVRAEKEHYVECFLY
ncbi:MAG: ABC transporter ATP-binding protein [Desulfurococcales archaeon]|nr:ABC transporter ATP-binding protein [Desulfurococcales archaeon]